MKNFQRAMLWRSVGVSVIPLKHKGKNPLVKWTQYINCTPTPAELKRYFLDNGEKNVGLLCGGRFGLFVVDFDTTDGYDLFMDEISKGLRAMFNKTYKVKTPRGMHVYFRSDEVVKSTKDRERKIDIKGDRGYVVAPFSMHPSGKQYHEIIPLHPSKILSLPPRSILRHFTVETHIKTPVDWDQFTADENGSDDYLNPYADLDDIRKKIPVLRLAMEYTQMFPEGNRRYWKGKCPVHNDKDPSFWVDTKMGLCGCFGNCPLSEKATDVIGLYARIHNMTYGEAVQELMSR